MKKNMAIMLLLGSISTSAFAKIDFPYSGFKEVEFENPYVTESFERFISDMHKQDLEIQALLDKSNTKFVKAYEREKRMTAYKEENERLERLGKVVIKEKKSFNTVTNKFIKDEIALFNNFIKELQNNKNLTQTEQIAFIKAIKPLHKAYQDVFKDYKILSQSLNGMCFVDYDDAVNVSQKCSYMYATMENKIKGSKQHLAMYMNTFVTKYKVESTGSNFRENLQNQIDEIKRMQSFKWE